MITQEALDVIYDRFKSAETNTLWIDVRQPNEWAEGTIPGVQQIMLSELEKALPGMDQEKTYVLVCRSGNRSNQAAHLMAEKGFRSLINFAGGMLDWYKAKYELAQ